MHRIDELKQSNCILGEAVMELLAADLPITSDSLLDKMHVFQAREADEYQQETINRTVKTIIAAANAGNGIHSSTSQILPE
ncbi:hypothetical protein [Kosakonia cowanii]|uniref:hypothetical protein n=1 Tax=Kosakonia cowanii TaxID=208223 RepID=UPI00289E2FAB|nr:hypothetical protein [Kosakonia cowanii]